MNTTIIQLLSDHLNGARSAAAVSPEDIDLAASHQLLPIVYYQTKDASAHRAFLQSICSYTQRSALLQQIDEAFLEIPYYTVKGLSMARYYPVPQLRTMGDCDIIVHECDKERAKEALLSIGFSYEEMEWDDMEWHFSKQGLEFELHHSLLYDETVNTEPQKAFAARAWEHEHDHELDVNFHFVYALIHLKKHLLNRGVGLRQFMDLAVMSKNAALDRDVIADYLKQLELEYFAGVCSALCTEWFGIALPVESAEINDEFFSLATETILANGVFGFDNPENLENGLLNSIDKHGKFPLIFSKLFPSYKTCCITPKYKWIKGKPYLMPVLWLYRPFAVLFAGRLKDEMTHIADVVGSDEKIESRKRVLAAWGLK